MSSGSAITPDPFMAIYSASKSAVESLTEGMRFELANQRVAVKLVEPGHIPTTNIGAAVMANSKDIPVPASYKSDFDRITAYFTKPPEAGSTTPQEVASTIMAAAMDQTDKLRFIVGKDVELASQMRRETSEDVYMRWTRTRFAKT